MEIGMKNRGKKDKKKGLYMVFIGYLAWFSIGTVLLIGIWIAAFSVCANMGWVCRADWMQAEIDRISEEITGGDIVPEDLLPEGSSYGVYSGNGEYLYGNFSEEDREKAFRYMEEGQNQADGSAYYRYLKKDNGEICIIRYNMFAQFANPVLRKVSPNAEHLFVHLFLLLFLLQAVWIARRFGTAMKRHLEVLGRVTEMIRAENLDFERESSNIREIDEILNSLFRMKEELKHSLECQWETEKRKEEQIAALAHDIKTPLTVLRGNAELAAEECGGDIREYNQCILEGAAEIGDYLEALQEMLHPKVSGEGGNEKKLQEADWRKFCKRVIRQAEILAAGKNILVTSEYINCAEVLAIDERKLYRAVMNIISNAAEYCPGQGRIHIKFQCAEPGEAGGQDAEERGAFQICVSDSGPGFDKEALVHGTEQFYQGDKSRSGKGHYGMGLYIAETFVKSQGGRLTLGSSKELGGAEVVIEGNMKRLFPTLERP